jgi:hypothetical protein
MRRLNASVRHNSNSLRARLGFSQVILTIVALELELNLLPLEDLVADDYANAWNFALSSAQCRTTIAQPEETQAPLPARFSRGQWDGQAVTLRPYVELTEWTTLCRQSLSYPLDGVR